MYIDASKYNPGTDWEFVAAYGLKGAILRDDIERPTHEAGLLKAGVDSIDLYHWSAPENAIRPPTGVPPEYWFADIEPGEYRGRHITAQLSAMQAARDLSAMKAINESLPGRMVPARFGIYTNLNTFTTVPEVRAIFTQHPDAVLWLSMWGRPSLARARYIAARIRAFGIAPERLVLWQFASGDARYQGTPAGSYIRRAPSTGGWLDCSIAPSELWGQEWMR